MYDYLQIRELYHSAFEPDVLIHHGIKGQKWGIRRYQNEDGTLTDEGKKKYYKQISSAKNYKNLEKTVKELKQNPIIIKAKQNINSINSKNIELHKKLKDFNKSLDVMISDYDDDNLEVYWDSDKKDIAGSGADIWRKDLKDRYLEFTKNPENLKNLEEYANNHKQIKDIQDKIIDSFIPKELKEAYEKIPDNVPMSKLDKKQLEISNIYLNYLSVLVNSMKISNQEYFAYGDLDRGPAPKEYLDYLDNWYGLQAFD